MAEPNEQSRGGDFGEQLNNKGMSAGRWDYLQRETATKSLSVPISIRSQPEAATGCRDFHAPGRINNAGSVCTPGWESQHSCDRNTRLLWPRGAPECDTAGKPNLGTGD